MTAASAREAYWQGAAHHANGNVPAAAACFDQAVEANPGVPEYWNNRGAAKLAQGDLDGAGADFDQAICLAPDYADALNNRGFLRSLQGRFADALGDFDRALASRAEFAEALANRAAARRALVDLDGARADYALALSFQPDNPDFAYGLAGVYHAQGALDDALKYYDLALSRLPRSAAAPVYHARGGARLSRRDYSGALADYNEALAICPDYCAAYVSRANARYHLRDLEGTADYFRAFELDRARAAAEVVRLLSQALWDGPDEVYKNCRQHLRISPHDHVARLRRGLSLLLEGRDDEAAADVQLVLRSRPEGAEIIATLLAEVQKVRRVRRSTSEGEP